MPINMRTPSGRVVGSRLAVGRFNTSGGAGSSISVTRDGPSNWYVPQTSSDFAQLGLATPDFLWLCQESSGALQPAISAVTWSGSGAGQLYQQTVTGWTRKFVGTDGATSGQSFRTASALLDLAAGESYAMLGLVSATTAGQNRVLFGVQGANHLVSIEATTGFPRTAHNNIGVSGAVPMGGIGTVRQLCWYRNAANDTSGLVTDAESIVGTHHEGALSSQVHSLGPPGTQTPPTARFGWLAIYKGANAERNWATYLATLRGL